MNDFIVCLVGSVVGIVAIPWMFCVLYEDYKEEKSRCEKEV